MKLPMIKLTEPQHQWLLSEQKRTGQTKTSIVRSLIQDKVDKEKEKINSCYR